MNQTDPMDHEAATLDRLLPTGPRVAIIGSSALHHPDSASTCRDLGLLFAGIAGAIMLTGGVGGAADIVARSFHARRIGDGRDPLVWHILPRGDDPLDYGETVFAGQDMAERREILGRVGDVYVVVEGGPGTRHEAGVALTRSAAVIPIARLGGYGSDLYGVMPRPDGISVEDWGLLAQEDTSTDAVVLAAARFVRSILSCG